LDIRSDLAGGSPVHPAREGKSPVVFGPSIYDVPLLPYEKQLIETIGITEEEYQLFAAEVRRRGVIRPAEYDHIPEIFCAEPKSTAVIILINLAISLTLTGVAYLLTPKPKEPSAFGSKELGGEAGASRFTPSRGFETLAELGEYASPIPLLFGLYREGYGGGMLATPKLIWSRMFSHGTLQRAKLLYVVGEQGVDRGEGIEQPELEGIFLGNNAIDPLFEDAFAFYWKKQSGNPNRRRVRNTNFLYGSQSTPSSGDPDKAINGEVFYAPTGDEIDAVGQFCHAYTPANSTQFGVFESIANGTSYRPNYRIVSITDDGHSGPTKRAVTRARIKIAGLSFKNNKDLSGVELFKKVRQKGQAGAGRNYSPRMGIVEVTRASNNDKITTTGDELQKVVTVSKGDKAAFVISTTSIDPDIYAQEKDSTRESVDDINSTVESMQLAADDAMQVGERFAIAGTIWKVIDRRLDRFVPSGENFNQNGKKDDSRQRIDLECVDTEESKFNRIGIVSLSKVVEPSQDFIGDSFPDGPRASIDEDFYPITKIASATVRNNRPAVVTEIGLKSTVFQKLNGLCSFNSLPTPDELNDLDDENVQITSGTVTANIIRSTVFRVFVRKAGVDSSTFAVVPMFFVIKGNRPVAQYNFIRFALAPGEEAQELEFKFVQFPGAELRSLSSGEHLIDLSHSVSSQSASMRFQTLPVDGIGSLTIGVSGKQITKEQITENKEFMRAPRTIPGSSTTTFPDSVVRVRDAPATVAGTNAKAIGRIGNISNQGTAANSYSDNNHGGRTGAFGHAMIGNAGDFNFPSPFFIVTQEFLNDNPRKWISILWTYERNELPLNHFARKHNGAEYVWSPVSLSVVGSSGNFTEGEEFEVMRGTRSTENLTSDPNYPDSNPFKDNPNAPDGYQTIRWSGFKIKVTSAEATGAIAGRRQAYLYQVFGDAATEGPIGSTKTVEREFTKGNKTMQVSLTSKIRYQFPEVRGKEAIWTAPEVVVRQLSGTSQDWEKGEEFEDLITITSNNPYLTEAYPKAGFVFQVGNLIEEITAPRFNSKQKFADQTQYSDISFYRNFVDKSNSSQPEHEIVYVNEVQENEVQEDEKLPGMDNLVLAGLSLKATRNFTRLDQLRMWLGKGLRVERLHPRKIAAYGDSDESGPSNLFTDLIYYLMTDQTGGAGALLGMTSDDPVLINKDDLIATSKFLETQKLFFNGPIVERTNLRQFIASVAPFFLCNFVIADGKFSLKPALPTNASGSLNDGPVIIEQIFTAGNILEDTLEIEYLSAEERRPFKAVVRYREERKNKLPQERTVEVENVKNAQYRDKGLETLPREQFDLTQFCTTKDHAVKVGRYFLALRRLVTHTISFSTTVDGLAIQAGSYIRVITESSPYSGANTGTVSSTGVVTSVSDLSDGMYTVDYYNSYGGDDVVTDKKMEIAGGRVADATFHGSIFTVKNLTVSQNVYVIEQLTFSQEGTVDIVASEHPCVGENGKFKSLLVAAMLGNDEVLIT
jgi:hypothetical protein